MVPNAAITPQQASHKSKEKMNSREYRTPQEFGDDLKLMFKNRYRYNQPEHDVFVMIKKLETVFDTSISGSSSKSSNFVENSEEERQNK